MLVCRTAFNSFDFVSRRSRRVHVHFARRHHASPLAHTYQTVGRRGRATRDRVTRGRVSWLRYTQSVWPVLKLATLESCDPTYIAQHTRRIKGGLYCFSWICAQLLAVVHLSVEVHIWCISDVPSHETSFVNCYWNSEETRKLPENRFLSHMSNY